MNAYREILPYAAAFFFIAGALARRHMGGWLKPDRWNARAYAYTLAWIDAVVSIGPDHLGLLALITVLIGGIWHLEQGHGWAHGMGTEAKIVATVFDGKGKEVKITEPGPEGGTLPLCVLVFWGNYATATMLAGLAWAATSDSDAGLWYAPVGLLTPIPYLVAWYALPWAKWGPPGSQPTPGAFLGAPTAIGELGIGGLLYGALPLAAWIAG